MVPPAMLRLQELVHSVDLRLALVRETRSGEP